MILSDHTRQSGSASTRLSGSSAQAFGVVGWSGAGKTTLIEQLLPSLRAMGLRISVIKHAHHGFDIDRPGKDSWRHREAGAAEVMLVSDQRWVLMHELRAAEQSGAQRVVEPALPSLLARLAPCDLVLVEGYKHEHLPKLEVYRAELGKPPLYLQDPDIVAIATDALAPSTAQKSIPQSIQRFALDDIAAIAALIAQYCVSISK
jgi:molybdopterin-guanine dinucleotide biosynthesis protein B